MQPDEYVSFVVRVWRNPAGEEQHPQQLTWCGEIEHIQSGVRFSFSTLNAEILAFLQQATVTPHRCTPPLTDEPSP